jgi:hypothetical protein
MAIAVIFTVAKIWNKSEFPEIWIVSVNDLDGSSIFVIEVLELVARTVAPDDGDIDFLFAELNEFLNQDGSQALMIQ